MLAPTTQNPEVLDGGTHPAELPDDREYVVQVDDAVAFQVEPDGVGPEGTHHRQDVRQVHDPVVIGVRREGTGEEQIRSDPKLVFVVEEIAVLVSGWVQEEGLEGDGCGAEVVRVFHEEEDRDGGGRRGPDSGWPGRRRWCRRRWRRGP